MKWTTDLQKLKLKLAFHQAHHRWPISDIIIQGLRKLIEKQELINKK